MHTQNSANGQIHTESSKTTKTTVARRKPWGYLIAIAVVLLALFGMKSCISSSRKSVQADAPQIELPSSASIQDGIPVYDRDIQLHFTAKPAFLEIVPDNVYQREHSTTLRKLFPGRLLGGELVMIESGEDSFSLPVGKYQTTVKTKWWIRSAARTGTVTYKENLDRILYSLVGRPVDGLCGRLVDRVGPGGLYGPDEFPQYAVGEFKPIIIAPKTK